MDLDVACGVVGVVYRVEIEAADLALVAVYGHWHVSPVLLALREWPRRFGARNRYSPQEQTMAETEKDI